MHNECSLDEGAEVEELANAGLPLLCSTQQRFCLCSILTLNSPATQAEFEQVLGENCRPRKTQKPLLGHFHRTFSALCSASKSVDH